MGFVDEANKMLNLPIEIEDAEIVEVEKKPSSEVEQEYQLAKKNIKDTIDLSQRAFETLVDVAEQAQSARAYEVVFNGLKALVESNKSLVDISKTHEEMKQIKDRENISQTNNNNLIISTSDLQRMLANES